MNDLGGVIIALKNLFDDYREYEKIVKNINHENEIDLGNLELDPTLLLLLEFYSKNNNVDLVNKGIDTELIKLPESKFEQQNMNFVDFLIGKLDVNYGGNFVLRHILAELTYNVHEHAFNENSKTDALMSFKIYDEEKADISIMDNGMSIPGRFDESMVKYQDDCNAIEKAINNFSTASNNPYERGNGLWTTIRLIVEGNGGEILIVSRNGLLHICNECYEYKLLDNNDYFKGTLISIRLNKFEVQNIYNLIELPKNNFFKYEVKHDYKNF